MKKEIVSKDGTKKCVLKDRELEIRLTETNSVIKRKRVIDYHLQLVAFSADSKKLFYRDYCRYAYTNPSVFVWDFTKERTWHVFSEHCRTTHIIGLDYNDDLSLITLADYDGVISLIRPFERATVWNNSLFANKVKLQSLHLNEENAVVWAAFENGMAGLSLYDGAIQTIFRSPSELVQ
ncbi:MULTISPECIES: hypothetical protein [unclassified Oleiphilus]|uniref:hypothetical protein n=1 Tax=unclassified Oleiphilus TaxID=2631174 RepID=UPI0007C268B9|nr:MULTISPECIES: hypothetical protein [unclassified Oleiphilus]KZZ37504.1 hypothetical protein A3757_11030 [Oleiphilus sp. HI0117]KZZ56918.1 hypothetical protein A3761_07550 [Oleiphilus sp. HI0123]